MFNHFRSPHCRQPYVGRIRGFSRAINRPTKKIIVFFFFIKYCKTMICLDVSQISPHHFSFCRIPHFSIFGRIFDSFSLLFFQTNFQIQGIFCRQLQLKCQLVIRFGCLIFTVSPNEKGLWSGGEFERPLPERPPM